MRFFALLVLPPLVGVVSFAFFLTLCRALIPIYPHAPFALFAGLLLLCVSPLRDLLQA